MGQRKILAMLHHGERNAWRPSRPLHQHPSRVVATATDRGAVLEKPREILFLRPCPRRRRRARRGASVQLFSACPWTSRRARTRELPDSLAMRLASDQDQRQQRRPGASETWLETSLDRISDDRNPSHRCYLQGQSLSDIPSSRPFRSCRLCREVVLRVRTCLLYY